MKLGIVVYTADLETIWNAFRLALFACIRGDKVKVILLGKDLENEVLKPNKYNIYQQMRYFVERGGEILTRQSSMNSQLNVGSEVVPVSTMADMYNIISESEKVVTL